MSIAETYLKVVEKRVEASAPGICLRSNGKQFMRTGCSSREMPAHFRESEAEGIIVAHWLTLLPPYALLWMTPQMRDGEVVDGKYVWRIGRRRSVISIDEPTGDSPFQVLAAYLMGGWE